MRPTARRRVLLADGDAVVRLAVDRQLDALGCEVYIVNTAAEAIAVIKQGYSFDILITSLNLPDLDGDSIVWFASRALPDVRVVYMSDQMPNGRLGARQPPVLIKPFSTGALADALARCPRASEVEAIDIPRQPR